MLQAYTPLYEAKVKRGFGPDRHLLGAGELVRWPRTFTGSADTAR
jgi:hypothetical protein